MSLETSQTEIILAMLKCACLEFLRVISEMACLKPNTHRRRDETVLSRRVGVGGVYMNSRRLPTDSAMRTHNAAVGRDPVYILQPMA